MIPAEEDLLDLMEKIFVYNPNKRIAATEALGHKYFANVEKIRKQLLKQ